MPQRRWDGVRWGTVGAWRARTRGWGHRDGGGTECPSSQVDDSLVWGTREKMPSSGPRTSAAPHVDP